MTSSASSDFENDEKPQITFPNYVRRREAFVKLVRQQTINVEKRALLDDHDIQCLYSHFAGSERYNVPSTPKVSTKDKFTDTHDENQKSHVYKSCQVNLGFGDVETEDDDTYVWDKTKSPSKSEDDVCLDWKIIFDSKETLMKYRKKYIESVQSQSFAIHPDHHLNDNSSSRSRICLFNSITNFWVNNIIAKVFPFVTLCKPSLQALHCSLESVLVFAIVGAMILILVGYTLLNSSEQIELPWAVFMKEPLLKGYLYSIDFDLYR